jgi:hypothetical protein
MALRQAPRLHLPPLRLPLPQTGRLTMARPACYSCSYQRPEQAAVYRWTCALSGNTVSLCTECCAHWRMTARDEPDLAPSAIHEIRG